MLPGVVSLMTSAYAHSALHSVEMVHLVIWRVVFGGGSWKAAGRKGQALLGGYSSMRRIDTSEILSAGNMLRVAVSKGG